MTIPYTFAGATTAIPLAQLDANFASPITLGNVAMTLSNTYTSIGNLTLTNVTVSSGNVAVTNANVTTLTATNDASISGLTVGLGGGAVASNTVVGYQSCLSNTTGTDNTAVGIVALKTNTTSSYNTAIGSNALNLATGARNTAVGAYTQNNQTTGASNSSLGVGALNSNTTGSSNVAIGDASLLSNTTASSNTAIGYQAGYGVAGTGNGNNIFLGYSSGSNLTTGSYNAYIGTSAQPSSVSVVGEIVIHASGGSTGKGGNTGFINPNGGGVYQGNNSATWSITSDARLKKNIVDNTVGLSAITAIQVRNFEYRTKDEVTDLPSQNAIEITGVQLGAIAQELQAILPECVKTESTGVMSVDTTNLTWYLINAVKELKAEIDQLKAK